MVFATSAVLFGGACAGERESNVTPPGKRRVAARPAPPERYGIGRRPTALEIDVMDVDVNPRGIGLPAGSGTHARGAVVFARKCSACHGARGEGMGAGPFASPRLIGRDPREGFPFGQDVKHVKTIGNYWPYATTVYDYIRRAMPLNAPGSLTPGEVYDVTAFLLAENEIISKTETIDAQSLPQVRMPSRGHFVPDDREGRAEFR